jgi:predicted lactoylglutathione lyase
MGHHLNMITLGVRDKARARAFYEALGWEGTGGDGEDPVFFGSRGTVVALWERTSLAADSHVADTGGWGGVTLAHCVASHAEVDAITERARAAGGTITREPKRTFWGGYSAMMIEPDGHPWEIAHNPAWTITDDGEVRLG